MTEWLFAIAWKSLLVMAATFLMLTILRRRSAADRSFIAHVGLVATLMLLPVCLTGFRLHVPLEMLPVPAAAPTADIILPETAAPAGEMTAPASTAVEAQQTRPALRPGDILPWLLFAAWLVPALLMLARIAVSLSRLFALRDTGTVMQSTAWLRALARAQDRLGFKEGAALLVSDKVTSPISWGFVRPVIIIDPQTAEQEGKADDILAHELGHVVRNDWLKLILGRITVALLWFNPLVWRLAAEADHLREEATDDIVLGCGTPCEGYARLLVEAVRHDNRPALRSAHGVAPKRNSLRRRIERVLDGAAVRNTMPSGSRLAVAALCALLVWPLAAITFEAAPATAAAMTATASSVEGPPITSIDENGLKQLDVDLIIAMRNHGVTQEYAAEIAEAYPSLAPLSARDLIDFSIHGVNGPWLREMREAGFTGMSPQQIKQAAIHGVSVDYAREMAEFDLEDLTLDTLVEMRIAGVDTAYVRSFHDAGYGGLSTRDLIRFGIHGVDVRSLEKLPSQE